MTIIQTLKVNQAFKEKSSKKINKKIKKERKEFQKGTETGTKGRHVSIQGEDCSLYTEEKGLRRNQPCLYFDLGFPASRL